MNKNMPTYVLKKKKLNKTTVVSIFRRNHLNIDMFRPTEQGWVFEEKFSHHGTIAYFKLTVNDKNIFTLFSVNSKSFKIKGNTSCFNLYYRFPQIIVPFERQTVIGNVKLELICTGRQLRLDDGHGFSRKKRKQDPNIVIFNNHPSTKRLCRAETSKSAKQAIQWNITHPCQGGKVSPK